MSVSSDIKRRQEKRRRDDTRIAMMIVRTIIFSGAMVAASIIYDVPGKIREKWLDPPEQQLAEGSRQNRNSSDTPKHSNNPETHSNNQLSKYDARELTDPNFPVASNEYEALALNEELLQELSNQRLREEQAFAKEAEEVELPSVPVKPTPQSNSQLVTVDLSRTKQHILLTEGTSEKAPFPVVQIMGLQDSPMHVELSPDSQLDFRSDKVHLTFPENKLVRFVLYLKRTGKNISMVIEPQMTLWNRGPKPWVLSRVKSEAYLTKRNFEKSMASLAEHKMEVEELHTWIHSRGAKDLEALGNAKKRHNTLVLEIKQMESYIPTAQEEVQTVNDMEAFANKLHRKARLEFTVSQPELISKGKEESLQSR